MKSSFFACFDFVVYGLALFNLPFCVENTSRCFPVRSTFLRWANTVPLFKRRGPGGSHTLSRASKCCPSHATTLAFQLPFRLPSKLPLFTSLQQKTVSATFHCRHQWPNVRHWCAQLPWPSGGCQALPPFCARKQLGRLDRPACAFRPASPTGLACPLW